MIGKSKLAHDGSRNSKWRDTSGATWMRSSLAHDNDETIVEVAELPDGFRAVRDGKAPEKGALYFTPEEWKAFRLGVKEGEFDVSNQSIKNKKATWVPSPLNKPSIY